MTNLICLYCDRHRLPSTIVMRFEASLDATSFEARENHAGFCTIIRAGASHIHLWFSTFLLIRKEMFQPTIPRSYPADSWELQMLIENRPCSDKIEQIKYRLNAYSCDNRLDSKQSGAHSWIIKSIFSFTLPLSNMVTVKTQAWFESSIAN